MPKQVQSAAAEHTKTAIMRHSLAHILAKAVTELYPATKLGIGPVTEDGFYYDFDLENPLSADVLPQIEQKMREIIKRGERFTKEILPINKALAFFRGRNEPYKAELIEELKKFGTTKHGEQAKETGKAGKGTVSIYWTGEFADLCLGPHVSSTEKVGAFKLTKLAGAYWRGSEKNAQLTRIYGIAYPDKRLLAARLAELADQERRDHRVLGQALELVTFADEVGPGLPLWLPKGTILREQIEKLANYFENGDGYERVTTPHIGKRTLYETAGHLKFYKDAMYPPMADEHDEYFLKPMNCPFAHMLYKATTRSYRDLPIRFAEYGTVYRYERSGTLTGLLRSRMLSMNDAHLYVRPDQLEAEVEKVLNLHLAYFKLFDMKPEKHYWIRLSLHDADKTKFVDDPKNWRQSEAVLRRVLKRNKLKFKEEKGEAAFYGPKIDFEIRSATGSEFTLSTVQIDFFQPARFGLTYIDEKGTARRPLVIHRAPLGTHERFLAFLIEHYGGAFPVWLAPEQVRILPIADRHTAYAKRVAAELRAHGVRFSVDDSKHTVGKKIREAELMKIPFVLVVGDAEQKSKTVAVRKHGTEGAKEKSGLSLKQFLTGAFKKSFVSKTLLTLFHPTLN